MRSMYHGKWPYAGEHREGGSATAKRMRKSSAGPFFSCKYSGQLVGRSRSLPLLYSEGLNRDCELMRALLPPRIATQREVRELEGS